MATEKTTKTQAETFFTQASERAREAVAHGTKTVEELNEFARGNVDAFVAAGRAAQAGFEKLAQASLDFSRKSIENGTTAFRTLAAAKTPNEFLAVQNDFAKAQFDSVAAEIARVSETLLKVTGEVFEPLSNRVAVAADRVAKAGAR